jgi:hypothetical protein
MVGSEAVHVAFHGHRQVRHVFWLHLFSDPFH